MNITIDMLESIGACDEGLAAFEAQFPSGEATWEQCVAAAETRAHKEHLAWLACYCPAGVEGATWEARLALQRYDWGRAWLGRECPSGVKGATWEARLALQRNDDDRAWLGRYCPVGVKGATFESRLAVQNDASGRKRVKSRCKNETKEVI